MKYGVLGDDPKPKRIGDALLEMYISSVQAFVSDKVLMFMIPHHPTTETEYFMQYSGFDPDDPTDHAPPNILNLKGADFCERNPLGLWQHTWRNKPGYIQRCSHCGLTREQPIGGDQ